MKKINKLDIVFLLDRSGSMSGSESDTIGGYNSFLEKEKEKSKSSLVTTVLFDNEVITLNNREVITKVKKLTDKDYYVRGCTALYDAIGRTIVELDQNNPEKVLFVITTDGLENASREYSKDNIKAMIKKHKNYEFIFLGAGIDSYREGEALGIKKDNISNYSKSKRGIQKMFSAVSDASSMVLSDTCVNSTWKRNLENYIENNKEL